MLSFRIPRYFDHSGARRRLIEAGFTENQAQGIVQALVEVTDPTVRTARILEHRPRLTPLALTPSFTSCLTRWSSLALAIGFAAGVAITIPITLALVGSPA